MSFPKPGDLLLLSTLLFCVLIDLLFVFCSLQPVFVEYVVIGNVNDAPEHAHELGELLRGRKVVCGACLASAIVAPH